MLKFWILAGLLLQCFITCNGIYNKIVSRGLDIRSQVVKMRTTIVFVNNEPSPIRLYNYLVDEDVDYFSIRFFADGDKNQKRYLAHEKLESKRKHSFLINLGQLVKVNETFKFETHCYIYDKINSLAMRGNDTHLVKYTSNMYYYSPYLTKEYFNLISVNSSDVMEHTHSFLEKTEADLKFFSIHVKPFTYDEVKIVYKTHIQFYRVTNLKRTVILSHWHNIFIKDEVHVTNVGPSIASFGVHRKDRKKYRLTTYVPETARNLQLYDDLGSIYNLDIEYERGDYNEEMYVEGRFKLLFEPRFPLLRSYKAHYILEYNLPTYAHISHRNEHFQAQIHLLNFILPEAIIEKATMEIVLPEGAKMRSERHNPKFFLKDREKYDKMLSFYRSSFIYNTTYVTQGDVHVITVRYTFRQGLLWIPAIILSFYLWMFNLSVCFLRYLLQRLDVHILVDS